jgi:hypothetical protein
MVLPSGPKLNPKWARKPQLSSRSHTVGATTTPHAIVTVVMMIVAPLVIAGNVKSAVQIFGQQRRSFYIPLVWMHQHLVVITARKKGKRAGAHH